MNTNSGIDFIGDIHGQAGELKALLKKLGYSKKNNTYRHPERTAIFVGDYIDRGPEIPETLEIVRRMADHGNAVALMGNHEYNAVCFHYEDENGGHLREHSIKNILQHYDTLKQFQNRQDEYAEYIQWFKTLPLYYETEHFRAVHACWDHNHIQLLRHLSEGDYHLTEDLLYRSVQKKSEEYNAVNDTLKGKELGLPDGRHFVDKEGIKRTNMRIKWWEDPSTQTWQSLAIKKIPGLPDSPVDKPGLLNHAYYEENEKPVFFGHYWLRGDPSLYRHNICCLDYSVANQGILAAYRFDGEEKLRNEKWVYV